MKILLICQYYYPEPFKVTEVAEALVKDGIEVTVLTGLPNYPVGIVPDEYKNGKHNEEVINGVRVFRCYERGRSKGAVNLALNYLSFYASSMRMIRRMSTEYDLIFSYQLSPIFMGIPARWYKMRRQVPMFLYCCDLWPESLKVILKGENNPIFKWVKRISKKVYESADMIGTQSDVFVDYLRDVHGIDPKKLKYIPNFADESYLSQNFEKEQNDVIDLVFTGNVGIAQDLEDVLEAFKKVCDSHNMRLHIVGGGARIDALQDMANNMGISSRVRFYGQRPVEEMPDFYKMADACIVSLKADNAIGLTLPAKVQGYMAAGKPILGMINGSCSRIIKEAECGFCANAGDIDGFSKCLIDFANTREMHKKYGENSRNYFLKNFRKEIHIKAIEDEINRLGKFDINASIDDI